MKASVLGLLIAAGAFGASTIYLAVQLDEERDHADQVVEQTRALNARIAELEKARDELESVQLASSFEATEGLAPGGAIGKSDPTATDTHAGAPEPRPAEDMPRPRFVPGGPAERSEAMKKMMRAQMRGHFKRMHADIGDKLGLSRDDANKLIDLMIEQQMSAMDRGRQERSGGQAPDQRTAAWSAQQEKNLAEVAALIGADKVDAYKAYQNTLPARQEVEMISRQLEANDLALSKSQRDLLVTALAEERQRVPAPKLSESGSREEYNQAMSAWQDDYNQRASTRTSSILNSDQQTTYTEYQQWSREMRQQFEARRAARDRGSQE
jgi:hypothetical protein